MLINITGCNKDNNTICEDPCNVLSYNSKKFSVSEVSCMGKYLGTSIIDRDNCWRISILEYTFKNIVIRIENVKYNDWGEVLSFDAITTENSSSKKRIFVISYGDGGIVTGQNCN